MTIRLFGALLCSGVTAFAILVPDGAGAAPVTGACRPTALKYSASSPTDATRSLEGFAPIPEARIAFTQGGTNASCVIVRFSAATTPQDGGIVAIRPVIDGDLAVFPLPISTDYSADTIWQTATSFEFIFPSVAPGQHVVRMYYRSPQGTQVRVHHYNMVIQYVP